MLELASSRPGFCEYGSSISPVIFVDEIDCLLEIVGMATYQNRTEDLLLVDCHVAFYVVYYCGTDEVADFVNGVLVFAAVKDNFSSLGFSCTNEMNDSLLELRVTNRTEVGVLLVTSTYFQLLCFSGNFLNPL